MGWQIIQHIRKGLRRFAQTPLDREVARFYSHGGNRKLRLEYPELSPEALVFDLGGYLGDWTSDIFSCYQPTVYIFEPVPQYYEFIVNRFKKNKSIHPRQFALGIEDGVFDMYVAEESSSALSRFSHNEKIQAVSKNILEFMKLEKISRVDLMKINIEGGEYALLEFLLDSHSIKSFNNLQIQFHDFVPQAAQRMESLQQRLLETHVPTFQYRFVWENWKLRSEC